MNPLKDDFNLKKPGQDNKECVHKDSRDLSAPTQSDTSGGGLSHELRQRNASHPHFIIDIVICSVTTNDSSHFDSNMEQDLMHRIVLSSGWKWSQTGWITNSLADWISCSFMQQVQEAEDGSCLRFSVHTAY